MGAVRLLAGFELRRRWLALVAVALMVALVIGAVAAALAGARRTSSSVERFRTWSNASDGWFQSNSIGEATTLRAVLAARPEVETIAERRLVNGFIENRPISDIAIVTDPQGRYGVAVDRPRVLSGRMPAPDRPDEIALNELAARLGRIHVGDVLRMKTWSTRDLDALFSGTGFPGFNGPQAQMTVVGIVRSPDGLPGEIARTSPYGLASPSFLTKYRQVGAWPPAIYVRTGSAAAFTRLSAAVAATEHPDGKGTYGAGNPATTAYTDAAQKAVNSASWALVVFALAVAIAGSIVIGQAVFRYLSGAASPEFLGQIGMTKSGVATAYTLPLVAATVVGIAVGMAGAVLASALLPLGLARRAEIHPGIRIDLLVLIGGAALALVLMGAFAFVAARRASGPGLARTRVQRRVYADGAAKRASLSPVFATGLRFAFERRTGERTVPVRAAFVALAVAVAGVGAASVVATSFTRLSHQPARWGWSWSSEPDYFGRDDMSTVVQRLVHDDRVAGVGELATGNVAVNDAQTSAWSMRSFKGDMAMPVRRGRAPATAGEIALGEATLDRAHARIGDTVRVATPGAPVKAFTVVGTTVFRSQSETPVLDDGAEFTPAGFASIAKNETDTDESLELRYPPGAHVAELQAALAKDYGLQFNAFTVPQVPGVIRNLAEARTVAVALAVFFAILGALALGHALVVGTGGRRLQIAVLRALGFRPGQVRGSIAVQASVLALAAIAIGLPAGVVLGRFVWRALTNDLGGLDDPATPWAVAVIAVVVTIGVAVGLSAWPARTASRARIAEALHAE